MSRAFGTLIPGLPPDALPMQQVRKPNVGENKPAAVMAEVVVDTRQLRGPVRGEWDQVRGAGLGCGT